MQRIETVLFPDVHYIDQTITPGNETEINTPKYKRERVQKLLIVFDAADILFFISIIADRLAVSSPALAKYIPIRGRGDTKPYTCRL